MWRARNTLRVPEPRSPCITVISAVGLDLHGSEALPLFRTTGSLPEARREQEMWTFRLIIFSPEV